MAELFNKDNKGPIEIQRLTGIYHASNEYSVIETEINDAMRTVAMLVGQEVMNKACELYGAQVEDETGLVAAVQLPVAILAVSRYTKNNLISHEDNGSKVKTDGDEKIPFEWMVDRDERAQRERYYRSMDALYAFLEGSDLSEWKDSDERKALQASVVKSINEFERIYPVDGSYYVYFMLQNLVIERQPALSRMVGAELWAKILAGGTTDEHDKDKEKVNNLIPLCRRYAVLSAIIQAARRWSLEVFPLSVARRFAPSYQGNSRTQVATREEIEAYIEGLEQQLEDIRLEMAEVLADGKNPWEGADPMPHNDPRNKFFSAQ